jgi:hypothetical protein
MAKPAGLTLEHGAQFKSGDRVFIARYGEREDWAYPLSPGAKMTLVGHLRTDARVKAIPAMPEVIEVIFVSVDPDTKLACVRDEQDRPDLVWQVPVGFVKTAEWIGTWQSLAGTRE